MSNQNKPWAVLISDVHYSLPTLSLADAAMRQAIAHADRLHVPLIVAGDLHDTKGAMRGECVKAMMATFSSRDPRLPCYVIPGNHDRINEKGKDHSLEFLRPLVSLVDVPTSMHGLWMIPYESDATELQRVLSSITPGSTLIMHTGVQTAYMGHYTQDKSSLPKEAFAPFRVISGHYHMTQHIKCGTNTFSYIGNPYTLNFGEAKDGPKGFQVLFSDGSLKHIATNLRKHIVVERDVKEAFNPVPEYNPGDLVKIKLSGPRSELEKLNRVDLGNALFGHADYRLDLVPDPETKVEQTTTNEIQTAETLMDVTIESLGETPEQKAYLKDLWRSLL